MPLLNDADALYLGDQVVSRVYLGDIQLWPAGFSPADIPGLAVWLDASQIPGAAPEWPVSPWPNLAPGGAVGTIVGSPAPMVSDIQLDSKPVVRFKVNEGRLRMTGTGVLVESTTVYVSRMIGPNVGRIVCAAYPPPNYLVGYWNGYMDIGYSTTGGFFVPDTRVGLAGQVPTPWIMYSGDTTNSPNYVARLFKDGTLLGTGGSGAVAGAADAYNGTFNLSGYDPAGTQETCDFEIAEVVVYNRKLSDGDRWRVEDYLRFKWQIGGG